jgi:hypothetical protein
MLKYGPNFNPKDYQIEHLLKWQTVAEFFTWVRDKRLDDRQSRDPKNPQKHIDFCKFWKATWTGARPQSFSLAASGPKGQSKST